METKTFLRKTIICSSLNDTETFFLKVCSSKAHESNAWSYEIKKEKKNKKLPINSILRENYLEKFPIRLMIFKKQIFQGRQCK